MQDSQKNDGTVNTKDVDIIVPVLNEREILPVFWQRLTALPCFHRCQVTFVDNASTDGSVEFIETMDGVQLLKHNKNEGYGASLIHGLQVTAHEKIIIIDADCEYPVEAIPALLQALTEYNVVYASRLLGKSNSEKAGMPWMKMRGNQAISALFNLLFRQRCTDLYTGCKALRRTALKNVKLERSGFEHVLELAAQLACRGYHIAEVPVDFSPRVTGVSKMSHLSETMKFLFWLVMYRWQLRKLLTVSS